MYITRIRTLETGPYNDFYSFYGQFTHLPETLTLFESKAAILKECQKRGIIFFEEQVPYDKQNAEYDYVFIRRSGSQWTQVITKEASIIYVSIRYPYEYRKNADIFIHELKKYPKFHDGVCINFMEGGEEDELPLNKFYERGKA